jgi:hypothetical protein
MLAAYDASQYRPARADEQHARKQTHEAVKLALANSYQSGTVGTQPEVAIATAGDSDVPQVQLIRGDSIKPEPITWLWCGYLAAGKLHIEKQPADGDL